MKTIGNAEKTDTVITNKSAEKEVKKVETTPILGLLPTHSEQALQSRYVGYVQSVKVGATETVAKMQRAAAAPVAKAHAERTKTVLDAAAKMQRTVSDLKRKFARIQKIIESLLRSKITKANKAYDDDKDAATQTFDSVVKPVEAALEEQIRAVANDVAIKITEASAEFTPLHEAARARRLEAEKRAKEEAEAIQKAKEAEAAANDNGEALVNKDGTPVAA